MVRQRELDREDVLSKAMNVFWEYGCDAANYENVNAQDRPEMAALLLSFHVGFRVPVRSKVSQELIELNARALKGMVRLPQ